VFFGVFIFFDSYPLDFIFMRLKTHLKRHYYPNKKACLLIPAKTNPVAYFLKKILL
jgi:hypothetical protein